MDKRKVILTSLASAAVLGASVLVSQPSVVKADEGKAEEQAVAPAQPQAGTEGESGAQTEKGSENASPANPGATNPAKMTKEESMKALRNRLLVILRIRKRLRTKRMQLKL